MALTDVLVDDETGEAFYLGFDLLLVSAPVTSGVVQIGESRVVEDSAPNPEKAARYAAIKVALLEAQFADADGWAAMIREAHEKAEALAAEGGLEARPRFDRGEMRRIDLGEHS